MKDIILVHTTTDTKELGLTIARDLVDSRLAACVQIGGPITSVYRWKDQVETAEEWICAIKTTTDQYAAVEERIRRIHTYEEPEIIALQIESASPGYLNWLLAQLSTS